MTKYTVTGMSCAACAARVEQAAKAVPGAENCAVNLLTGVLSMEGSADPAAVIAAVTAAGYGASLQGEKAAATPKAEESADRAILRRLIISIAILLPLLYLTMGSMLGAPLPAALKKPLVSGIVQLLLAGAVLVINRKFFISGVRGVLRGAPNMDTLVALGAGTAYLYSTVTLLRTAADPAIDDALYFESAAMILTLITVGKLLESRAKGKTTSALRALADRMPKTAIVERDGAELTVPAESLRPGDVFLLRPGSAVPVDGKVAEGSSAIDESALTGESIPMEKSAGDKVHAGTVNAGGFLRCEATAVGEDTTLAEILRLVEDASATKAPIARTADRVAAVFVPAVLFIAAITCGGWLLAGRSVGFALARAISVLVISCPCALGLATPVAIMVGSGVGAKNGLLFKTAAALEQAGRVKTVVFDKTGTITKGKPAVTDIRPASGVGERELLTAAAILEKGSEHPLAAAILAAAEARGMEIPTPADFVSAPGGGVSAAYDGAALKGGNASYLGTLPEEALAAGAALSAEGKTPLYFTKNGEYLGCIAVADELRESAPAAAEALRKLGVRTVLLTGDTEPTARAVAVRCGISDVRAGVLPAGKAAVLTELKKAGKTAMVGDGVNDAPALTVADLGIAIGAGTDVAIDAADTVLTASDPMGVAAALRLGRSTLRNIRENLFWAFFYNVICIPLAAGITGWEMSPMLAAAAMSISSFCVVMNALRLNLVKLYPQKEKMKMETVELKIEGMMCPHCEARVKAALEAIPGVKSAAPSHEKNNAVVTLESSVPAETLAAAVTAVGYKVL